jgi:MFS family permease
MSAPAGRRNFVAAAAESVSFAVANHLTAAAVVLPFICLAFGGSAFAAALIFPTYTAANLLGVVVAPRVLGLRSVTRTLALILALIATVFAVTAVGILFVSPAWLNALWVVAAVLGLLAGIASIAVVEVMSSALASSEKATLSVVQSTGGAVLTLAITVVLGTFFLDPSGRDAHLALLWIGITAMVVAALSLLRIRPSGSAPAIRNTPIGILTALRARPDRKNPWVREFLITQVLFLSIALGTSFYSVHSATLHGQKSEALHYIVAVTAVGSLLFTALWTLSRRKATIRGLLLTAAVLGVCAAVAALIADYGGAQALPILSGVVIVFAAAGGAATSSTRSTWMYLNLGNEDDTEVIIFCQIVLGVTATGVGLVFSMLARLDAVAPAWVMLILSGYALIHARRGPRVRIAEIGPDHVHSNHGRHFGGFHW